VQVGVDLVEEPADLGLQRGAASDQGAAVIESDLPDQRPLPRMLAIKRVWTRTTLCPVSSGLLRVGAPDVGSLRP